jgi:hypothetical protein
LNTASSFFDHDMEPFGYLKYATNRLPVKSGMQAFSRRAAFTVQALALPAADAPR